VAAVQTLQRAGLEVMGGFIVGFDSDRATSSSGRIEFIQRSAWRRGDGGIADRACRRHGCGKRLKREGRLEAESTGNNSGTPR